MEYDEVYNQLDMIVGFVWNLATPPKLQCRIDLNRTNDRTIVMVTAKDNSNFGHRVQGHSGAISGVSRPMEGRKSCPSTSRASHLFSCSSSHTSRLCLSFFPVSPPFVHTHTPVSPRQNLPLLCSLNILFF